MELDFVQELEGVPSGKFHEKIDQCNNNNVDVGISSSSGLSSYDQMSCNSDETDHVSDTESCTSSESYNASRIGDQFLEGYFAVLQDYAQIVRDIDMSQTLQTQTKTQLKKRLSNTLDTLDSVKLYQDTDLDSSGSSIKDGDGVMSKVIHGAILVVMLLIVLFMF